MGLCGGGLWCWRSSYEAGLDGRFEGHPGATELNEGLPALLLGGDAAALEGFQGRGDVVEVAFHQVRVTLEAAPEELPLDGLLEGSRVALPCPFVEV